MRRRIFEEVYADAAMGRRCPNCHVAPNAWCRRPDGKVRSVPCIARLRLAKQLGSAA